jgi:hypothetical protein
VGNLGLEMWVQCYGDTVVVRYSTNGGNTRRHQYGYGETTSTLSGRNIWYGRITTLGSTWVSSGRMDLSDSPIIVGDPTNPNRLHIIFMIFNTLERKARYITGPPPLTYQMELTRTG